MATTQNITRRSRTQARSTKQPKRREASEMFFATDWDGDTVVFSGGLSLYLDQDGDVYGEMTDESEIKLLSQMLSWVGRS